MSTAPAISSTSIYTEVEKKDSYNTLDDILKSSCSCKKLHTVIKDMLNVIAEITIDLRTSIVTVEGVCNTFGDSQLSVDVIADRLMWDACKKSSVIREGASEEDPIVKYLGSGQDQDDNDNDNNEEEYYTVCWDPLDGSSIVDNNWAVGTIIGIWGKETGLIGATGRDQKTAIVAMYGPRTTVFLSLDDGVYEFTYGAAATTDNTTAHASWICTREKIQIKNTSKIFSPANLRATQEISSYNTLIQYYINNKYTLRYTGGLVPDVCQQFTKQQGIFINPTSDKSPAKLRLAFEAAPFALLVEKAGGKTSDGITGGSILDVKINGVDQRTAMVCGSSTEVDRFNDIVLGEKS